MILRRLTLGDDRKLMTDFFYDMVTKEPWNDDWSDADQLNAYMTDLAGNANSLCFGFFKEVGATGEAPEMLALAIG